MKEQRGVYVLESRVKTWITGGRGSQAELGRWDRAMVLRFWRASESPGGLTKTHCCIPPPVSGSVPLYEKVHFH